MRTSRNYVKVQLEIEVIMNRDTRRCRTPTESTLRRTQEKTGLFNKNPMHQIVIKTTRHKI